MSRRLPGRSVSIILLHLRRRDSAVSYVNVFVLLYSETDCKWHLDCPILNEIRCKMGVRGVLSRILAAYLQVFGQLICLVFQNRLIAGLVKVSSGQDRPRVSCSINYWQQRCSLLSQSAQPPTPRLPK